MDFQKITLTPDGYIYIKWISKLGNIWESWVDPQDVVEFIKTLVRL